MKEEKNPGNQVRGESERESWSELGPALVLFHNKIKISSMGIAFEENEKRNMQTKIEGTTLEEKKPKRIVERIEVQLRCKFHKKN